MVKKAQWLTRGVPLISYPCTWFIVPNDEASLSGEKKPAPDEMPTEGVESTAKLLQWILHGSESPGSGS